MAALVIFSAAYTYKGLNPSESRRVNDEARDILNGHAGDVVAFPAAVSWRYAGWHFMAALHAVAMARLNVPGLVDWPTRLATSNTPNRETSRLYTDFRAMDAQTGAALSNLQSIAPDIESQLPSVLDDPSHDMADLYGPRRTVRDAMRSPQSLA